MALTAREAAPTGQTHLWRQWLQFEAAHPGAALLLASLVVLIACGAVLGAVALLPMPEATTATATS